MQLWSLQKNSETFYRDQRSVQGAQKGGQEVSTAIVEGAELIPALQGDLCCRQKAESFAFSRRK